MFVLLVYKSIFNKYFLLKFCISCINFILEHKQTNKQSNKQTNLKAETSTIIDVVENSFPGERHSTEPCLYLLLPRSQSFWRDYSVEDFSELMGFLTERVGGSCRIFLPHRASGQGGSLTGFMFIPGRDPCDLCIRWQPWERERPALPLPLAPPS